MSKTRATDTWKEIKPFAMRDIAGMLDDGKSASSGDGDYFIILYDVSAEVLRYYSMSEAGMTAALAAASSGDIVWMPAGTITSAGSGFVVGDVIDSGSLTVTSYTGNTINGLTIGNWYALRNTGGPWTDEYGVSSYNYHVSNTQTPELNGNPQSGINPAASGIPWVAQHTVVDTHYDQIIWQATTTEIYMSVATWPGDPYLWDGVTGSLGWQLNEVSYSPTITIPAGVELVGMGDRSVIAGNVTNAGIMTNLTVTGVISNSGTLRIVSNGSQEQFSRQISSILPEGTAPLDVDSTTLNVNLNADLLDGYHAATLPVVDHTHDGSPNSGGALPFSGLLTAQFHVDGRLAVLTDVGGGYVVPDDLTIQNVLVHSPSAGAAGTTIIDVNINGVTAFTTQANRPALAYDDADGVISAVPDITSVEVFDVLTVDIDQVATGAEGLNVIVAMESAYGASEPIETPPAFALDPYKPGSETDNIALALGAGGAWDDARIGPSSIVEQGGTLYLYYTGNDGATWQVGIATAPVVGFTGSNWTKYGSNPITDLPAANTVLYDVDAEIWKAWYGYGDGVGYATASSPFGPWTVYPSNPVMPDNSAWEAGEIGHVRVLRESPSSYKMLYTGASVTTNSRIGLATSPDGITWTKEASNPVIDAAGTDWMQTTTFCPTIPVKIGNTYHIYYNGKARTGGGSDYSRIGKATSTDLINWTVDATSAGAILNGTRAWEGVNSPPGEVENPVYIQVGTAQYIFYGCWWGDPSTIGFVVIP